MELSDQKLAEVLEYLLPQYEIRMQNRRQLPFMCIMISREKDNPLFNVVDLHNAITRIHKRIEPHFTLFSYLDEKCDIDFDTGSSRINYLGEQAVLFYKAWLEELKNGSSTGGPNETT